MTEEKPLRTRPPTPKDKETGAIPPRENAPAFTEEDDRDSEETG